MTLRYLLDTNIISYAMPLRPVADIVQRLAQLRDDAGTGAPVAHELLYGILRMPIGRRRQLVEEYFQTAVLEAMTILPYDQAAAEWHARERARLVALGRTPPYVDGQIAAIAATNGLVLVTANPADFADFQRLAVEDWSATGPF